MINICYTKRELNYIFINHCQKAILDIKYIQLGSDSIKTKNKIEDNEIPKSVLKMKKDKEKREKEEVKNNVSKTEQRKLKKEEKKARRKKLRRKILFILILLILICVGVVLGVSAYTWKNITKDMFANKNSVVLDVEGNTIATLGSEQKKMTIPIEKMPENLVNAYVSIEDERFYSHHGVDIKRTGGAILSYITHFGNSSYGGSTITQQLVKNLTGDSTDSITRKVKEWWKAFLLESYFSKEEILEMYLNVIYVGPNIYGVQTGAKYYFNKDISDLSLAQCAYLAGINNSPNSYNPFTEDDNIDLINKRTSTVLNKMLELGKITEKEYNEALKEIEKGLNFEKGKIKTENPIYSYHTDALISQVISDISKKKDISETFAANYLYMAGLTIHSTQNSDIQDEVEKEFLKKQYLLTSKDGETTSQAAMVIIDHKTGNVLACTGGLGEKEYFRGLNRATQSERQTGSSIKPLAVLVPGIDKKIFTGATIYEDKQKVFDNEYKPGNNDGYLGNITVRRALESSQNIPFVEMMEQITPKTSIEYLEKIGISSLTEKDKNLALALGGLDNGITPLEMAGAYATIANDGEYIEPTFYTSITNNEGKIVFKAKQETRKVFSEQVAYVIKELLKQPVEGAYGTATYCRISGIDVAAKTGTTDENYDKWLCGFTPYYTAVTWFGFDQNESIYYNNQNPAGIIWANVMRRVHSGLEKESFEMPSKIAVTTICADTGKVARTGCKNTYIEYFLWGTVPEECTKHSGDKAKTNNESKGDSSEVYVDKDEDLKLNPDDEAENKVNNNIIENTEIIVNEVINEDITNMVDDTIVNEIEEDNNIIENEVIKTPPQEENVIITNNVSNEIESNVT